MPQNIFDDLIINFMVFVELRAKFHTNLKIYKCPKTVNFSEIFAPCFFLLAQLQALKKSSLRRFNILIPKFFLCFAIKRDIKGDRIHPY
jgi:hypothetical protein